MDGQETLCKNPACRRAIVQVGGGHRKRQYCDDTCRQAAHRARQQAFLQKLSGAQGSEATPSDDRNIEAYQEKLAQAAQRIEKLERQVEIQRQRLGQYYQRFYPSSLAVAEEKLLALGAVLNYKPLLKYDELTVGIASGDQAWREFARSSNYDELAQAILQAQRFYNNLAALHASAKRKQADQEQS